MGSDLLREVQGELLTSPAATVAGDGELRARAETDASCSVQFEGAEQS
jgi:hypothetical protein